MQGAYLRGELKGEFTVIKRKTQSRSIPPQQQSQILDFRYCTPDSLSVEHGFRITIISEIPDSLSWIPNSKR